MFRCVLDTNIFVSAFVFNSANMKELLMGIKNDHNLFTSPDLIDEIMVTLENKFKVPIEITKLVLELCNETIQINPEIKIAACRDPKDNHLLELAQASKAHYLITGDKDLLSMSNWLDTKIITPREFREMIEEG